MEETLKEVLEKCKKSPYYFATNFIKVKDTKGNLHSFTTHLTEKEFNSYFNNEQKKNTK